MSKSSGVRLLIAASMLTGGVGASAAATSDARLRAVIYDPRSVVTVPVKRGVVTHILLAPDETITDIASGLGGDCSKPEAVWCVAAQAGGRSIFVKAKSGASAPNNLAVVTDKRSHAFRFVVLADNDSRTPVYRLVVEAPFVPTVMAARPAVPELPPLPVPLMPAGPSPQQLIAERLHATPELANANYSIAEGKASEDIVPSLVFDDGRFTYLRFPGNREIPAVFHVQGDGSETLVNTRMEGDLLVVDRVSRRLMLRAGQAVVGIWNEAFDLDGAPPKAGTTAPGVERAIKGEFSQPNALKPYSGEPQ